MTSILATPGAGDPGAPVLSTSPEVVDQVALARLYGEPLFAMPQDLYLSLIHI